LADWKFRHKKICKRAAELRVTIEVLGSMMQDYADAKNLADDNDQVDSTTLTYRIMAGLPHPPAIAEAVKVRRKELRDEKNRGRKKKDGADDE